MTKTKRSDVDLLIFDLDGTLLDTALYIVLNYLHLFEKYRVKVPTLTEMVYFSGPPLTTILPKYFPDVPPERTFIIGDSKTDIECGRNAGTNTGLVTFGLKKTDDIFADERYGSYQDIERSFIHERQ